MKRLGYEHAFLWLVGLQALCVVWTLLRLRNPACGNERGAAVNIALRIVEIVLPVLVDHRHGHAIPGGSGNKPDMRVVNRLNLGCLWARFWCWPNLSDN